MENNTEITDRLLEKDCCIVDFLHPPEKAQHLLEQIAFSEGLFWRKAET